MRRGGLGVVFAGMVFSALGLGGCAARPPPSDALPRIVIAPGSAERVALMDRYRLHDEVRKRWMARPHTWVEEVSEEDVPESPGAPSTADPPSDPGVAPLTTEAGSSLRCERQPCASE